ncbi:MAG: hypothetical protein PVF22_01635 [Candidatus Aminicenantes bacterium]|jgi:hypothetical protein
MKKRVCLLLILAVAGGLYAERRYKIEESEAVQKTLKFQDPAKPKELSVDNIFGFIHVEGIESKEVRLSVKKTIKARTSDRLQKAKEEVSLDITEDGNTIDLFVDGPFRDKNDRNRWRQCRDPGYEVHYDFTIKVPLQTSLYLKTVTDGNISVKNVEGDFEVKNVNGTIVMTDIAGSGTAHTVNGKVEASFVKNPKSDCSFKTLNGHLIVLFQPDLSADFWLKTFTGDAYSAFPINYLPSKPGKVFREKGKYVYEGNKMTGVRIGTGGPEIKMDTMTGDIFIEKFK